MMRYRNNAIQILTDLGLSLNQARIYLANLHCGPSTAKVLADFSKIGREDVYRLLSCLEKKHVITRQISYPTLYEAIPLKAAIDTLLKNKQEELFGLQKHADMLITSLDERSDVNLKHNDGKILYFKSIRLDQVADAYAEARSSVDVTTRCDVYFHLTNRPSSEIIVREGMKALKRGVKIRTIIDKPEKNNIELFYSTIKPPDEIAANNFQFRFAAKAPESILTLFDERKALVWTASEHWDLAPYIEVTIPSIVNLVKAYFSALWQKSEQPTS